MLNATRPAVVAPIPRARGSLLLRVFNAQAATQQLQRIPLGLVQAGQAGDLLASPRHERR